jgi:ectoine hydroxylase-related dioxygenase (phytanoyl-CoA dioxygenase family)
MYTIIEDCSPYYIRFTHPGIEQVIAKCIEYTKDVDFIKWPTHYRGFTHYQHPQNEIDEILRLVPLKSQLPLKMTRASEFVTQPGRYYRAHKDGVATRVSINYTVKVLDDKCVTSWYSDDDLKEYCLEGQDWKVGPSRECVGFDKKRHTPLKTMTAQPGECILFNTDIYHDFDNSQSTNERMVLTLRLAQAGDIYFDDVKKILFGT